MLKRLADDLGRPLTLVARGGLPMLASLRASFQSVVLFDSTTHMKTVHRMIGTLSKGRLRWDDAPGKPDVCIEQLMQHNSRTMLAAATPRAA
jgi:hypothetical protein